MKKRRKTFYKKENYFSERFNILETFKTNIVENILYKVSKDKEHIPPLGMFGTESYSYGERLIFYENNDFLMMRSLNDNYKYIIVYLFNDDITSKFWVKYILCCECLFVILSFNDAPPPNVIDAV